MTVSELMEFLSMINDQSIEIEIFNCHAVNVPLETSDLVLTDRRLTIVK